MATQEKGRRLTVSGWTQAERELVDAAAQTARLSVTAWAWRRLVEAARQEVGNG